MKKIVSSNVLETVLAKTQQNPEQLLDDLSQKLREAITSNKLDISSGVGKVLYEARSDVATILELMSVLRTPRSQASSTVSLSEKLSHDFRQMFKSYQWVSRGEFNGWESKRSDFRAWVESGAMLPKKDAELNCWEAVMVMLYFYGGLITSDIKTTYAASATTVSDGNAAQKVLGLDTAQEIQVDQIDAFVQPGDVLEFTSTRGEHLAHVVLVLENDAKARTASHWIVPKSKMLTITPSKIISAAHKKAQYNFADKNSIVLLKINALLESTRNDFQTLGQPDPRKEEITGELLACIEMIKQNLPRYINADEQKLYDENMRTIEFLRLSIKEILSRVPFEDKRYGEAVQKLTSFFDEINLIEEINLLNDTTVRISTKFRDHFAAMLKAMQEE